MAKDYLELYTDYLISNRGLATATGLSAMTEGEVSHDQINRCLAGGLVDSKQLWKQVKPVVREVQSDDITIPIGFEVIRKHAYCELETKEEKRKA